MLLTSTHSTVTCKRHIVALGLMKGKSSTTEPSITWCYILNAEHLRSKKIKIKNKKTAEDKKKKEQTNTTEAVNYHEEGVKEA